MNQKELSHLIDGLNSHLLDFANKFNIEKQDLVIQLKDDYKIDNERTLAIVANSFIRSYFKSKWTDKYRFMVDEFHIHLKDKDKPFQKSFSRLVDNKNRKEYWKNCYVDGYLKIDDLVFKGDNHIFIEYKLQQKFVFADLATDFLKYKIYTASNDDKTVFVYTIFNKSEILPEIIDTKLEKYVFLDESIKQGELKKSRIYIYVPEKNDNSKIRHSHSDLTLDLFLTYSEFSDFSREYNTINYQQYREYNEYELALLENSKKFNMNVFASRLIQYNYPYIVDLWNKANDKNIFDEFKEEYIDNKKRIENMKVIIEDGSSYISNFEGIHNNENTYEAETKGLRASVYSSFFLLVTLDFFAEEHQIINEGPRFFNRSIGRGKRKKSVDYYKVAADKKEKLKDIYKTPSEKKNIDRLSYDILFFLTEIYPLLFEIGEDNKVFEKTVNQQIKKLIEKMQNKLNEIIKKCKYEEKINLLDDDEIVEENLKRLSLHILRKVEEVDN